MSEEEITFGIVEDEIIEAEAMRLFIENNFEHAKVIWCTEDGQSGLDAWKKNPPHILIIDIHMPVMDGLTLCQHLMDLQCDSVIVINTAYDDFCFAKRAISLRAFDYIVKPADNSELLRSLQSCIKEAHRRQSIARHRAERSQACKGLGHLTVARLFEKSTTEELDSKRYLEPMGWPTDRDYQTSVLHFLSSSALDTEKMHILEATLQIFPDTDWLTAYDFVDERHMIALIEPRKPIDSQRLYTLLWMYGKYYARRFSLLVYLGNPCPDKETIVSECAWSPKTYLSGKLEMNKRNWKILRMADSERLTHTLERFFTDRKFSRAIRHLNEIKAIYKDSDVIWELIQWVFLAAQNVWPDQYILESVAPLYESDQNSDDYDQRMISFFTSLPSPDTGDVIDRALHIMKSEFGQDLSQANLSARLGLEQGYFSRLFKKRCGRNFSEVLTEIRMQHAEKLLLSNPSITLDELCCACGLSSKTYFSEVFKKWKGMTITQFLKIHKQ